VSLWSLAGQVFKAALSAARGDSSASSGAKTAGAAVAIVKAGPVTVTWAQVKAAGGALPALARAVEDILKGQGSVADYELVGDDVLKVAALDPALAAPAAVAAALLPFVIEAIASGAVKGDQNPIADGQTSDTPHSGRRA